MKELGHYLKKTRISNGVSLEEAADDLELSASQLENIESGNSKAFKDVYDMKEYIKGYAKYLGLDPDMVMDEFNNFLFEHTSRISLDDIKEAQKKAEEKEEKKVKSPYTKEYKDKINIWPAVYVVLGLILITVLIYFIVIGLKKNTTRDSELHSIREENLYELTY